MSHVEFFILLAVLLWLIRRVPPPTVIASNLSGMQNQFDLVNKQLGELLEREARILEILNASGEGLRPS